MTDGTISVQSLVNLLRALADTLESHEPEPEFVGDDNLPEPEPEVVAHNTFMSKPTVGYDNAPEREPEPVPDDNVPEEAPAPKKRKAAKPKPVEPAVSRAEVRTVLVDKSREGHTAEVRDILAREGVIRLSDLDASRYGAVMALAEALS